MRTDPAPHGTSGRVVGPEGKVVARHRSPQGRRTHLGLPLPPTMAAAGAGGGAALTTASAAALAPRVIATVIAGGALAAAGEAALTQALPVATDGANVLRLSVQELIGPAPAADPATVTGIATAPLVDLAPAVEAAPEPRIAEVGELVKAAELHNRTARAAAAEARTAAPTGDASGTADIALQDILTRGGADADAPADSAAAAVQMVTGRVSSGFGARWGSRHRGLDIAAPIGTPIRAPMAGEVIDSGPASGFGLWVRLRHDDGTVTTYGHVNRSLVRVGDQVTAGEEIAEVGNRGRSTGPHLHMEVRTPAGTTVNPRPWLDQNGIGY
jgi:murein DD-endopeptidase MepM/ murein hydrolase activator NlpD